MTRAPAARAAAVLLVALLSAACGDDSAPTDAADAPSLFGPHSTTGPLDALTRRFGRLRERMRDRGYDVEVGATRVFVLETEGVALPLDLRAGRCTTFVGIAGGGVRRLSLAVFDAEGAEVAADATEGEGGLVHVCPQPSSPTLDTVPHHLVVRSLEGAGAVIVGAFETIPGSGEGFDGLFEGIVAPQVRFRDVEERLSDRRTLLRERGFLPLGEPHLDRVAEGEDVSFAVTLSAGRCYVAMARGGEGLTDIDLVLLDPDGAEVARDLDRDAEPDVELCPEEGGHYAVIARAFEGAGALGVLVLGGPAPEDVPQVQEGAEEGTLVEEPESEPPPNPVATLSTFTAALESRGYGAPAFVVPDGWVARGEVRSHDLALGPGCFVVVGAAGRAETDLDLYLSAGGQTVDRDTGVSPTARVRLCAAAMSTTRVTVKTYGRGGSYALATVRAPEPIRDLRALRLEEATAELRLRGWTAAQPVDRPLVPGEPIRMSTYIRAGRCTALAVAGDEGLTDVDVFLRDADGRLLASSSGPEAFATVARCAEEEDEDATAEVVAYRGSGTVTIQRLSGTP